ncbi:MULTISPECIES: nitroreductase [unclassified Rhodococcus (in: high G+C Gram-positive bacteria)]|uniref:nitroreductase n=1 Tax=unclassified Rhodococcus (in: high G+C Gram-positive bacteria) TaxID=192944 RepID=UPI0006F38BDE|nr:MULTISPECIES: nitroreductase [unclassified Rhodococcus (in: high G+C Gram-positive bacteria)]KQU38373.1 nitroreductase [Rhodococcus sp. Leaf225]KQU39736.1 nitroreductase [Rhodococcus sp. Leaf258]
MSSSDHTDTDVLARLLRGRSSCRGYVDEQVPRHVIEHVLDLARLTPSWCNTQPWHLLVTEGAGTARFRDALVEYSSGAEAEPDLPFPLSYSGIHRDRRRECGWQLYESVGVEKGDRAASSRQAARNFELFGAPHTAIVTTEAELGVYGAVDCGLYVQTFLLAAHSVGLAAVPQAALAAHSPFIRKYFDLPENRVVLCGISFGYPDAGHPANGFRTRRAPVEDTFDWVTD